jgi:hypothetical protein
MLDKKDSLNNKYDTLQKGEKLAAKMKIIWWHAIQTAKMLNRTDLRPTLDL